MGWLEFDKGKKASFKKSVGLHFAKCIYIMENPTSKLFDPKMKEHGKKDDIELIPKSLQVFIKKEIRRNIKVFIFQEES